MKKLLLAAAVCMLVTSCGMIPLTEKQVQDYSARTGNVVEAITAPALNSVLPGTGGGIAGALGGAVTLLTAFGLNALRKKNKVKFETEVKKIAKGK